MNYLKVFEVLTGVRVSISKFFRVGAGVLKHGAGAESESEKCDSTHLWFQQRWAWIRTGLDWIRTEANFWWIRTWSDSENLVVLMW